MRQAEPGRAEANSLGEKVPRYRKTVVVLSLLLAVTAYGQDAGADSGIEFCKWVSILAKDVMTARQHGKPMSETLPFALDRLRGFHEDLGVDVDELSAGLSDDEKADLHAELERSYQEVKPAITKMVLGVYKKEVFTDEKLQRDAISDFENGVFASCYMGYEEAAAGPEE